LLDLIARNFAFIFLSLLLSQQLIANKLIERHIKSRFWLLLGLAMLRIVIGNLDQLAGLNEEPSAAVIRSLLSHAGYMLNPLILYVVLLVSLRGESKRLKRLLSLPLLLSEAALLVSLFTGIVVSFPQNVFTPGPFYAVTWVCSLVYLVIIFWSAFYHKKHRQESIGLLIALFFIGSCMLIEILFGGIVGMQETAIAFSLLAYYLYFQSQAYLQERMEFEQSLNEARLRTMIAQIHPHFVCNALSCVAELCHENAAAAEEAVLTLAGYLRSHYQAIESDALISFEHELENIGCFLSLEQQLLGERMRVVLDTPVTDFKVPGLSIETLVENAVRHGVAKKRGGGTVTLRTEQTDGGIIITVSDDGPGFDRAAVSKDNALHIGLNNAQTRLEKQCRADIDITTAPEEGCTVRIRIPKEAL